uniref:Candidate secreted effector n=1 Tax=Meloidogyne incognita TaxID=6306 RepID=A0A914L5J8_MELIC
MFLKILIFFLIINKIIADDSNSGDSGNENSNSKPNDEFADSVDVRADDNEQQPSNSIDKQNLQDPQFIKEDDTNGLQMEYTTEKIKDEEDQLNNEGSGVDNVFPEEDNDVNELDINTTAKYANDIDDNDNNESDGQSCVYENGVIDDNGEERTPTSEEQQQIEEYLGEMREFEEQMVKDSANFMRSLAQYVMSQFENIFGSSTSSLSRNNNNLLEKKPLEAPTPPCLCKKCDSMTFIQNKQNKYFKNFN